MFLALLLYEILEGTILIKLINISLKPSNEKKIFPNSLTNSILVNICIDKTNISFNLQSRIHIYKNNQTTMTTDQDKVHSFGSP